MAPNFSDTEPRRQTADGGTRVPFVKGHGTGNDFVIIDALDGQWDFSPSQVAALCDRRFGIGADGLLRVIKVDGRYFMDYRNGDGSLAETCGNGLRVFCTYLHSRGLLPAGTHHIGTRGGVVSVTISDDGAVTVDMGSAQLTSADSQVEVILDSGGSLTHAALGIAMPNPHCVALVDDLSAAGPLLTKPQVDPQVFPEDANVEFVKPLADTHIAMRVWERGVGETLSCGSGACAAAFAAARHAGLATPWSMHVDVPGGTLTVACDEQMHLHLSGPAVLIATGEFDIDVIAAVSA